MSFLLVDLTSSSNLPQPLGLQLELHLELYELRRLELQTSEGDSEDGGGLLQVVDINGLGAGVTLSQQLLQGDEGGGVSPRQQQRAGGGGGGRQETAQEG